MYSDKADVWGCKANEMTGQAEKEFEEWFRHKYPEPILGSIPAVTMLDEHRILHRDWEIKFISAKESWTEAHSRQQEKIEGLREGIRDFFDHIAGEDHGLPNFILENLQKLLWEDELPVAKRFDRSYRTKIGEGGC